MPSDHNARFGELRSLLHRVQEGPGAWARVCLACEAWPDPTAFDGEVVPYVNGHLASWSDATRSAPVRWIERGLRGEVEPALRITRRVELRMGELELWEARTLGVEVPLGEEGAAALERLARPGEVLERVTMLELVGQELGSGGIEALCSNRSAFGDLRALELRGEYMTSDLALERVCAFASRRPVEALSLTGGEALGAVAEAPGVLDGLRTLRVDELYTGVYSDPSTWLGSTRLERLALQHTTLDDLMSADTFEVPETLTGLDLAGVWADGLGLGALSRFGWFERLEHIGLSQWTLADAPSTRAVEAFAARWRSLDMMFAEVEDDLFMTLAMTATSLVGLDMRSCARDASTWTRALRAGFPALESLTLGQVTLDSAWSGEELAAELGRLREVDVGELTASEEPSLELLAGLEGASIERLAMPENVAMAAALGEVESLGRVRRLNVAACDVDDAQLERLVARPWSAQLEQLDLRMNLVSVEGVRRARASLPECDVVWYPHGLV